MLSSLIKGLRVFFWTTGGLIKKYRYLIVLSILLGIGGFLLLTKTKIFSFLFKPHLRVGIAGQYTLQNLPEEIYFLLSQGLTKVSNDGLPLPGLASYWQVSDDNLTYTFYLKDNIFWQDGKPIKAEDIEIKFTDVEKEVVGEKILRLKLQRPFAPFLISLSKPVFKKDLIGTGPFKIIKIKKSGENLVFLRIASSEKVITFRFYPTLEKLKLGFQLGEIDTIEGIFLNPFPDNWQKYLQIEEIVKKDSYIGLFYNTKDSLLGNKNIRQALTYAIKNKGKNRAYTPINPNSWAYNPEVKKYEFDKEKAVSLLEKGTEGQNKKELKIKIYTTSILLTLAEEIKNSWQETLGIETEIEVVNTLPSDYQVFLGIQKIPLDPDQYFFWHSKYADDQNKNITHFEDLKIDKLLEDGRKITDWEKRKEIYADFQKFLLEECPVAFLSYPSIFKISRRFNLF